MTPTDDEILAAAMEAGFAISTAYGQGASKLMPISDRATLGALYRHAYAAGMEAAAAMLERMAMAGSDFEPSTDDSVALYDAAADIRAANGREGKS